MSIKTYNQALDYIYSFINLEKRGHSKYISKTYSLDNIEKVLAAFDNPHKNINIIHIAGTKGKGSTALFCTALLQQTGASVATFMSPHLVSARERILVNGEMVKEELFITKIEKIRQIVEKKSLKPTTFEVFFLLYLLTARKLNVDWAVIEVGLGGRLDCTNIVTPRVSVITPIGMDHTDYLGNSIASIAREKGGIIKNGVPVVIGQQRWIADRQLIRLARIGKTEVIRPGKQFILNGFETDRGGMRCTFKTKKQGQFVVKLRILGRHQVDNLMMALSAVTQVVPGLKQILKDKELQLELLLPGRMHRIATEPDIIVDVAHTKESARTVYQTCRLHYPGQQFIVLLGLAKGKNYKKIIKAIAPLCRILLIHKLDDFKVSEPKKLLEIARKQCHNTHIIEDFAEAIQVMEKTGLPLLVTGSFYLAGPFLEFWGN